MNKLNCVKDLLWPTVGAKISFFIVCMKEVLVFTFLALWLTLVHIFGPRKDKACCPMVDFRRAISSAIYAIVLYWLKLTF